ncbi:unnamed protein product, partial [Closterium sp. NIES-65]
MVAQVGVTGGWHRGWHRWVAQVGDTGGRHRWVAQVGGTGGWHRWAAQVGGTGGWHRWVAQVGGTGALLRSGMGRRGKAGLTEDQPGLSAAAASASSSAPIGLPHATLAADLQLHGDTAHARTHLGEEHLSLVRSSLLKSCIAATLQLQSCKIRLRAAPAHCLSSSRAACAAVLQCRMIVCDGSSTRLGPAPHRPIGLIQKHVTAQPARCSSKLGPSDDSFPESSQTPDDTFSGDKLGETQADSPIGKLSNPNESNSKGRQPDDSSDASVSKYLAKEPEPEANPSDESDEPSSRPSSLSDRAKERLQRIEEAAAAAKSGSDPFKGMVAVAAQRLQDYFDKTSLVGGAGGFGQEAVGLRGEEVEGDDGSGETAWQRWERVFGEVEEREAMLTSLQFQLDDLVGDEDFTAAAKLQAAIRAVEDQDAMAAVFRELKAAVAEERYGDAKHLRDDAGAGLVSASSTCDLGGKEPRLVCYQGKDHGSNEGKQFIDCLKDIVRCQGKDEEDCIWGGGRAWTRVGSADPFGRLVHVSQQHGKLLAKSYTAKQLSVAGQGIPIFEVYVARNAANPKRYDRQSHPPLLPLPPLPPSLPPPLPLPPLPPLPPSSLPPGADDSLSRVLDFFRERLPDVKLRVFPVVSPADVGSARRVIVGILVSVTAATAAAAAAAAAAEENQAGTKIQVGWTEKEAVEGRGGVGGGQGEGGAERSDGEEGSEDAEGRQGIAVRVVVGGVFPGDGAGESVSKVPARIEWRGKDAFVLTVEDSEGDGDAASSSSGSTGTSATDPEASQSPSSSPSSSSQSAAVAAAVSERLASAATRAAANLMPEDVAKQLWGVDRFSGPVRPFPTISPLSCILSSLLHSSIFLPFVNSDVRIIRPASALCGSHHHHPHGQEVFKDKDVAQLIYALCMLYLFPLYPLSPILPSPSPSSCQEVFKDKDVAQLIRTAVQHVQRRRYTLPRTTAFTRIHAADASTDPFAGLYVGAYGPYTSEAIQVRRRFGTWEEPEGEEQESQAGKAGERVGGRKRQGERALVPPFEYVEGVKLTGDFNVPAGKVSFRAKIGRHWQMPFRGVYPDELGVVARYPGQGQLAEPGFRNPRWVDGELLVFDGK